jgi:hypothetical protein
VTLILAYLGGRKQRPAMIALPLNDDSPDQEIDRHGATLGTIGAFGRSTMMAARIQLPAAEHPEDLTDAHPDAARHSSGARTASAKAAQ